MLEASGAYRYLVIVFFLAQMGKLYSSALISRVNHVTSSWKNVVRRYDMMCCQFQARSFNCCYEHSLSLMH